MSSAVIKRWYTASKLANGGNKNLIDLLIVDVTNKTLKVKINAPIIEKEDVVFNGEIISTIYTSRFGFELIIKVLIREGYTKLEG